MGNSSKNLARYSLWMPGVHGRKILDSNLLGLIRSLCQGNVCKREHQILEQEACFRVCLDFWKGRVGPSRHWKVLNNTSETSKVLQLLWSFSKLFPVFKKKQYFHLSLIQAKSSSLNCRWNLSFVTLCVLFCFVLKNFCKFMLYFIKQKHCWQKG